ncbi:MAG: hypothetical protein LKJ88_05445 [Bacilli bacterium]|jgi:hypothetical protein|nr:hypothetical protein [Bacilli bacterium]
MKRKQGWTLSMVGLLLFSCGESVSSINSSGFSSDSGSIASSQSSYETSQEDQFFSQLYQQETAKTTLADDCLSFRASDGYLCNQTQGYNGWSYLYYQGEEKRACEFSNGAFRGGEVSFTGEKISFGPSNKAVRSFQFSKSGKIKSDGYVYMAEKNNCGCQLEVFLAGVKVFPLGDAYSISGGDEEGVYFSFDLEVKEGETLDFVLSSKEKTTVGFNPQINFGSDNNAIHPQNEEGYFGDVIPYYKSDEHKMYLYYMTGDISNPAKPVISNHLATSRDLFHYQHLVDFDSDEEKSQKYASIGMDMIGGFCYRSIGPEARDANVFDFKTYPEGYRDNFLFFDEDKQVYRYLFLCYIKASGIISCALGLMTSDDASGKSWSTPIKTLKKYANYRQPECPFAWKIGKRWYLGCSLWGNKTHGVGRMEYYMCPEGMSLDNVSLNGVETRYLDGEDLCAGQMTKVGPYYMMFGWIPSYFDYDYFPATYVSRLWGGDINLPRLVYPSEDGTLFTRIDSVLKRKIKRGRIISGQKLNIVGTFTAGEKIITNEAISSFYAKISYVQKKVGTFSFNFTQGEKNYSIEIIKSNEKMTIDVVCLEDSGHTVASSFDFPLTDNVNLELTCQGGCVECYINDSYSLSARISAKKDSFTNCRVKADSDLEINSLNIYKLQDLQNLV